MVGITICIVIRLQESVVACVLQPWSGGKDPDRYRKGAAARVYLAAGAAQGRLQGTEGRNEPPQTSRCPKEGQRAIRRNEMSTDACGGRGFQRTTSWM
jgi:hypothetical protein